MSSKRGRKRNDNLPPNRARDVQRAFRARRAAHLQALEQRVAELEEENEQYRQALNLPPSNRSPLGKGPTGKDKPKPPYTSRPPSSTNSTPSTSTTLPSLTTTVPANNQKSRPSPESPSSSSGRTHSLSPSNSMSVPSQPFRKTPPTLPGLETGSSWDHPTNMVIPKEQQQQSANQHASPRTASFTLNPGPHSAQPQLTSFGYSEPMPSRSTPSNALYMSHPSQSLPPPPPQDRPQPVREQYSEPHFVLRDVREERQHYSFSQPSFPSPHDGSLHSPVPHDTSQMNSMAMSQHRDQMNTAQQQQQQSFAHRRSITEPHGFRGIINTFPHLPSPQAHSQHPDYPLRLPPPQKVADPNGVRSGYGGHESRRMI